MLKWLKDLISLKRRFEELQKAHDLRAVLNGRLSATNQRQKAEIARLQSRVKGKPLTGSAQQHINRMSDAMSLQKARHHVLLQRYEVRMKKMALLLSYEETDRIQAEVEAMTDAEVLIWKKPKREIATSISN